MINFKWSSVEEESFISVLKWQTGTIYVNSQNCFVVNFGYNGKIPIPSFSLPIDIRQNLTPYEFDKIHKCYFVFVGGKYVDNMQTIVDIVEDISEQIYGRKPIAMFVLGKFSSWEINNFTSHGRDLTKVNLGLLIFIM